MVFVIKNAGQDLYGVDQWNAHWEFRDYFAHENLKDWKPNTYTLQTAISKPANQKQNLRPLNKSSHFSLLSFFFAHIWCEIT